MRAALQDPVSVSSAFPFTRARISERVSRILGTSIVGGLFAVLVVTALAHGAVEPWSMALFELFITSLLVLWAVKAMLDRGVELTIPPAFLPIGAFLLLGIAQSVALTASDESRVSLSLDVEATRRAVTLLFFLAASFILATNFLVTRGRLLLSVHVLTVFGSVLATFALIQYFTWDNRLYWLRSTEYPVFGPFVNHNHFAGYMAMLAPLPLSLILTVVRGQARLIYGFAAALMGTAAIVSGSRSGVISLVAALVFVALLSRRFRMYGGPAGLTRLTRLKRFAPILVVTLAILAGVLWIGATPIIERFGKTVDTLIHSGSPDLSRAVIWRDTLEMIRDFPILGAGLGTYQTIYPAYAQTQESQGLNYAHNDYLQVLAEGGLAGGMLAIWFIVAILYAVRRGLRSGDPLLSCMSLAAGAGTLAVFIQSLSDTDLQIPSNAFLFLILSAFVSRLGMREVVLLPKTLEIEA